MKKSILTLASIMLLVTSANAQKVEFEEYKLDNGMHVILHQDKSAPVIITSVMYGVGGKDGSRERTGFAHFFEHLLFEGTEYIGRGEWMKIVSSNGGKVNANTSQDRTYYYEIFPSNKLELGLWMESARLLQPIISQEGVDTQNEVVKEEKRQRTRPYSEIINEISKNLFKVHPYKDPNVGYMKDLDAATLEEFLAFNKKYYVPNNATLVVAGDIDFAATKKMIQDYFGPIPRGADVVRSLPTEEAPITEEFRATAYDENIQIPAVIAAYRTPSFKTRDSKILDMISSYLSAGKSSVLYKKMVDTNKQALAVQAVNISQQDYGIYALFSLPLGDVTLDQLIAEMDEEIVKIQTDLISEKAFQKLQNQFENNYVNSNASVVGIAGSLASYHVMYGRY